MTNAVIYKSLLLASFLVGVCAQNRATIIAPRTSNAVSVEASDSEAAKLAEEKLFKEQAENAVYKFATSLVDGIMDNMQHRTETRDGLSLTGSYSYSDGFFNRTVNYAADQDGYRILSEYVEALGDGPIIDENGKADISTSIGGQEFKYSVTKADFSKHKKATEGSRKVVA